MGEYKPELLQKIFEKTNSNFDNLVDHLAGRLVDNLERKLKSELKSEFGDNVLGFIKKEGAENVNNHIKKICREQLAQFLEKIDLDYPGAPKKKLVGKIRETLSGSVLLADDPVTQLLLYVWGNGADNLPLKSSVTASESEECEGYNENDARGFNLCNDVDDYIFVLIRHRGPKLVNRAIKNIISNRKSNGGVASLVAEIVGFVSTEIEKIVRSSGLSKEQLRGDLLDQINDLNSIYEDDISLEEDQIANLVKAIIINYLDK